MAGQCNYLLETYCGEYVHVHLACLSLFVLISAEHCSDGLSPRVGLREVQVSGSLSGVCCAALIRQPCRIKAGKTGEVFDGYRVRCSVY